MIWVDFKVVMMRVTPLLLFNGILSKLNSFVLFDKTVVIITKIETAER